MKPTLALVVALLATTATAITQDQATPSYVASPIRPTPDATNRSTGFRPGGFFMTGGTIRQIPVQVVVIDHIERPSGTPR